MQFSINKNELYNAVSIVIKAVSSRSTLPILSGILISTKTDAITLQSTNLDFSIKHTVGALIEEEGSIVLPATTFSNIIKTLPNSAVHIKIEEEKAQIFCENTSFSIDTLSAIDFPSFPEVNTDTTIHINAKTLQEANKAVYKFTSKDNSYSVLTGILMEVSNNALSFVATDSLRLAIYTSTQSQETQEIKVIIPNDFLQNAISFVDPSENIDISVSDNQIVIQLPNTTFINRRIEGNYPNYQAIIPSESVTEIEINKEDLLSAVKRASIIGNTTGAPLRFIADTENQTLTLIREQGNESLSEQLNATVTGQTKEVRFNCSFILEGLSVINSDVVDIQLQEKAGPGVFTPANSNHFLYLVMPINI